MERRDFLKKGGSAALGMGLIRPRFFEPNHEKTMTASSLNAYLRGLVEVDEPSVDKIIIGDPETVVKKIGTAWMPYWSTLKEAHKRGVNTMVVHEPTFYTHRDLEETQWDWQGAPVATRQLYQEQVSLKKAWILENGMVVIRCHDVLDKIKGYGLAAGGGEPWLFGRIRDA